MDCLPPGESCRSHCPDSVVCGTTLGVARCDGTRVPEQRGDHVKQRIDVLPTGPNSFAVFVLHGNRTSHHRVVLTQEFLLDTGLAVADEAAVAHQALACLLEHAPENTPPEVIYLTSPAVADPRLVQGLQARLSG